MVLCLSWASALVAVFAAVMHSYLGERYVLRPIFAPGRRAGLLEESAGTRRMIRAVWHLPSFAWAAAAVAVVGLAMYPASELGIAGFVWVALVLAGSGLANALASRGRHFGWAVLGLSAALALGAAAANA